MAGGAEKAVVADLGEARGEDVLEEPGHEVLDQQGHAADLLLGELVRGPIVEAGQVGYALV